MPSSQFRGTLGDEPPEHSVAHASDEPTPEVNKEKKLSKLRAAANWRLVRKAVNGTRFWKRMATVINQSGSGQADLGSLKQFVDKRRAEGMLWTAKEEVISGFEAERRKVAQERSRQISTPAKTRHAGVTSSIPGEKRLQCGAVIFGATKGTRSSAMELMLPTPPSRPQTTPKPKLLAGPRRQVNRVGDQLSYIRRASPRHKQLLGLLPGDREISNGCIWHQPKDKAVDPSKTSASFAPVPPVTVWSNARPITAPAQAPIFTGYTDVAGAQAVWTKGLRQEKEVKPYDPEKTSFTLATLGGTCAKPRAEVHQLLTAFEGMQQDEGSQLTTFESGLLSQQLEELRWGELRRGFWTAQPERRPVGEEVKHVAAKKEPEPHSFLAPSRALLAASIAKAGKKDVHGDAEQMERLIHLLDPEGLGIIKPDVFVPLMFWLGVTRRRAAALTTLDLAFGGGPIDTASVRVLAKYAEVQIRLVDGLRQLARRESLEQLCEYITDMIRVRTWFHTMKRDTTGHADIVEVQNLFARMEVTSDRQALFRFLSHLVHSDSLPSSTADKNGGGKSGAIGHRTFGISDFASLISRCAIAWCLHRTLFILHPTENALKTSDVEGPMLAPAANLDREVEMRWVALQRKIIVSLLVNHRFWGRESRTVLMSLSQPQFTTFSNQLTPEQWLSLFQRVRAQGIASTLPTDIDADDPDWLRKKATGANSDVRRAAASEASPNDQVNEGQAR